MPHIELRPDLFGITSLLDYRKASAGPLCELTQLLLRGASTLTESERELIAAYVSYLNECSFCTTAHAQATCLLSDEKISLKEVMSFDAENMDISDKIKSLLRLAAKVQRGGQFVKPIDIEDTRTNGATDLEIHDTVLIAALFCLYNRYVDGLDTVTPEIPSYYEALGKRITTRGYRMPVDGYQPLKIT